MKTSALLMAFLLAVTAYFATARETQKEKDVSLLDLRSADDVRTYFRDLANTDSDSELLRRYQQLLKDIGVAPLIAKGNTIPIRNGGQIIVVGDAVQLRNRNNETATIPAAGIAMAALDETGSWSQIPVPNETVSLLIRSNSGTLIVDLKDGVVARLKSSEEK